MTNRPIETPVYRPSFLQAFLASVPSALAGGLKPEPGSPFGTGLPGALQGIEQRDQRMFENSLATRTAQRQDESQAMQRQAQASTQAYQSAETANLQQQTRLRQMAEDYFSAQIPGPSGPTTRFAADAQKQAQALGLSKDEATQFWSAAQQASFERNPAKLDEAIQKISVARQKIETRPEPSYEDSRRYQGIIGQVINEAGPKFNSSGNQGQIFAAVAGSKTISPADKTFALSYMTTHPTPQAAVTKVELGKEGQGQFAPKDTVIGYDSNGREVMTNAADADKLGLSDITKADASTVNQANKARQYIKLSQKIQGEIDTLDKAGKLGPLAGRWNDFLAGTYGAGDADYQKLKTDIGLANTLLMNVHVGSRGGSYLLEHFEDMANAKKMDAATLRAGIQSEFDYALDKAALPPSLAGKMGMNISGQGPKYTRPRPGVVVEQ